MKKILIILPLLFIISCQNKDAITSQENQDGIQNNYSTLNQKQLDVKRESNFKDQGVAAQKDREIIEARAKISLFKKDKQ